MSLPIEAEELLDDLRRRVLDRELKEIAMFIELYRVVDATEEELKAMQLLERIILRAYHQEGGYAERQHICEEIARLHR